MLRSNLFNIVAGGMLCVPVDNLSSLRERSSVAWDSKLNLFNIAAISVFENAVPACEQHLSCLAFKYCSLFCVSECCAH